MGAKTANEILEVTEARRVAIEAGPIDLSTARDACHALGLETGLTLSLPDYIERIGLEFINKRGKIGKRIRAAYHDLGCRAPSDSLISRISEAYIRSDKGTQCIVDVVDEFWWSDGKFGHDGSCYWDTYTNIRGAHSRDTIADNNGYCLRFYNEDTNLTDYSDSDGIGRTWMLPVRNNSIIMLFNHYGSLDLSRCADVLQQLFEDLKDWTVLDHISVDSDVDYPYINNRMCTLLVSPAVDVSSIERPFYPKINPSFDGDYFRDMGGTPFNCENCGRGLDEDDCMTSENGDSYCEDCYSRLFRTCHNCGDEVSESDSIEVDGDSYCEDCLNRLFTYCTECEAYIRDSDYDNHLRVCKDCATALYPELFVNFTYSIETISHWRIFAVDVKSEVRRASQIPVSAISCPHCNAAFASILYSMAYDHIEHCKAVRQSIPVGQLPLF